MPEALVQILTIDSVEKHPNADRLTLNRISNGATVVSNLKEDGTWRYAVGQRVAFIPFGAIIPDVVLETIGYWDAEKQKGILDGAGNNTVMPRKLRGVETQGLIVPLDRMAAAISAWSERCGKSSSEEFIREGLDKYSSEIDLSDDIGITWADE